VASTYAFVAAPSVFVLQLRVSWRKKKEKRKKKKEIDAPLMDFRNQVEIALNKRNKLQLKN
jgi:hypothetical protein